MGWDPPAVGVFALCALLELLAEPLWVLAQAHQHTSLRVRTCSEWGWAGSMSLSFVHSTQVMAKGAGQVLKVLLVLLGIAAWPQLGLLIFCAGQVRCSTHCMPATTALTPLTTATGPCRLPPLQCMCPCTMSTFGVSCPVDQQPGAYPRPPCEASCHGGHSR